MLLRRVIPCLLLKEGRLVKTVKFKNPRYVGDPVNAIKIYNEKEVDELIVVDITASAEGREPPFGLLRELTDECFMPLCYGGGIRNVEQMRRLFELGIEKVAINTVAAENPKLIEEAASRYGSQSVVLSVDVKRSLFGGPTVRTMGGKKNQGIDPVTYIQKMVGYGVGEVLLNSIDRDGTWSGFDLELVKRVTASVNVPVIACGGAGSVEDIKRVFHDSGASAAALGSMAVFQGKDLGVLINFPTRTALLAQGVL